MSRIWRVYGVVTLLHDLITEGRKMFQEPLISSTIPLTSYLTDPPSAPVSSCDEYPARGGGP